MKIEIDAGHGGVDSGAVGNGLLEKNINLDISLRQKALFEKLGHEVRMTRTTDINLTLDERARLANEFNADVCISNHVNEGGGKGFEAWHTIYGGKGQEYAQRVNTHMSKIMTSRGLKTRQGNNGDYLGMIRMPKMPAVLFEFGFVDNVDDTNKLKQESFRQQCAEAVVKGILNINEIQKENITSTTPTSVYDKGYLCKGDVDPKVGELQTKLNKVNPTYKLVVDNDFGTNTENAVIDFQTKYGLEVDGKVGKITFARLDEIIKVIETPPQPLIWYRVLIDGVNLEANRTVEESKDIVCKKVNNGEGTLGQVQRTSDNAIVFTYTKPIVETPPVITPPKQTEELRHPIMGQSEITVEQAEQLLHNVNTEAPYFAKIYKEEGEFEGVRWDIAFAQSIKETGYFRFGNDVSLEQNNFAGIGAIGNGVQGATFLTPQEGIRAQIQHLKGYATTEAPKKPIVDPRYDILKRNSMLGIAPNVEDLNDRWASGDFTYGQEIMKLVDKMKAEVVVKVENKEESKESFIDKIIKGFIKILEWLFK